MLLLAAVTEGNTIFQSRGITFGLSRLGSLDSCLPGSYTSCAATATAAKPELELATGNWELEIAFGANRL